MPRHLSSIFPAFLVFALVALPAKAGCPTRADLAQGIVLSQNEPGQRRADFIARPKGVLEEVVDRTGPAPVQFTQFHIHGLIVSEEISAEGIWWIDFKSPLGDLDRLDEVGSVTLEAQLRNDAGLVAPYTVFANFIERGQRDLGGCVHDIWRVAFQVRVDGETSPLLIKDYAPGIDLVLAEYALNDSGAEVARYEYDWIGTAADVAR